MLLPYYRLPAIAVGMLLLVIYTATQQQGNDQASVSACEAARPRFHDAVTLLLLYLLVMYLRTISLQRMLFLPGQASDDVISAVVLAGTIVIVFVSARAATLYHLFPDLSPKDAREVGSSERTLQYIGTSLVVALILLEMASHVHDTPAKGPLSYVPWFFAPRIMVLGLWVGISYLMPLPDIRCKDPARPCAIQKRVTFRAYAWAFTAALFFVRPRFISLLGLGVFLGLMTYEISTYGAQPLVSMQINDVFLCPYAVRTAPASG